MPPLTRQSSVHDRPSGRLLFRGLKWHNFAHISRKKASSLSFAELAKPQNRRPFANFACEWSSRLLAFIFLRSCSIPPPLLLYRAGSIIDWIGTKVKSRDFRGSTSRPKIYGHRTSISITSMSSLTTSIKIINYASWCFFSFRCVPFPSLLFSLCDQQRDLRELCNKALRVESEAKPSRYRFYYTFCVKRNRYGAKLDLNDVVCTTNVCFKSKIYVLRCLIIQSIPGVSEVGR